MSKKQVVKLQPLSEGPGSTFLSWNGTCPESPNGERIAYFRMPCPADGNERDFTGEIWICDRDLTNHRKVFEMGMSCTGFQHNGGMQMWIDDNRLAFRTTGGTAPFETIYVVDADTGEVSHKPIVTSEGGIAHYAVDSNLMFGVTTLEEVKQNQPNYAAIDEPGLYALDCDSGKITKIAALEVIYNFLRSQGYTPDENDKFCHVMPNFDLSRVMTRWVPKEEGILFSCNVEGGEKVIFPGRPLHQLWFDNETYFAVNREAQNICRFNQEGTVIETLAGPGNHIDASPDRQWVVTDSGYHQTPITISLYRRGEIEPAVELVRHNLAYPVWKMRGHANPVFSRDGTRVYFNHAVGERKIQAVVAETTSLLS